MFSVRKVFEWSYVDAQVHLPHPLILASTSAARRKLLAGLGIAHRCESPGVDESLPDDLPVARAVAQLARRKADAVSARHPGALVLGADQLVELDGVRLGKPPDRDAARAQLSRLGAKSHSLFTGVCLTDGVRRWEAVDQAKLTFYPLPPEQLERYLDLGEWEGCAGGYRVEGRGQALISDIEGDRTNIEGLPMLVVVRLLREAGVDLLA